MCFCFLQGGPGASKRAGGGPLSESSISLRLVGPSRHSVIRSRLCFVALLVPAGARLDGEPLFVRLQRQRTYICQFDLLAALCAYITFPDILGNMLAHHFLDNLPAMQSLIKGGSSGRIFRPASCTNTA